MIKKETKKPLHFTPWRKTEWKLSYEDLILLVYVKNSQRRDFPSTFCIKIWKFLFIVREYFLTNTYLEKIHLYQTKNLLQFTPWRKTKWKLVYEEN